MMSKLSIILILGLSFFKSFGQGEGEQTKYFLENTNGIVYIDNSKGTYFTVEFPGDSLKETDVPNAYLVDDNFFQIMKFRYSSEQYSNSLDTNKEIELLKYYEKYETDYLEKELFEQKLKISSEIFKNKEGKRFYLWYYSMPQIKHQQELPEIAEIATHQIYLTFVCNENVCGINTSVTSKESFDDKIKIIKNIAETIDIYGHRIDLNGLYYKLEAQNEGRELQYTDTIKGFEFDIPNWINLTENNSNSFWIATLPDIDNIKNAILVQWFDKSEFKSFEKFNDEKILNKKTGDKDGGETWLLKKELRTLDNCNGVCFKAYIMSGNSMYHRQYVTFKTKEAYLLVVFTATENTYKRNLKMFNEFVSGVRLLN